MKRLWSQQARKRQATSWQFFGLAFGMVVLQRLMLAAHDYLKIRHTHLPNTAYQLLVRGYAHWDGTWYVRLAETGYLRAADTAFWPLYPWLMRGVHAATHLTFATCGVLISLISFVFAVFLLGMLVKREFSNRTAIVAMSLFTFFPTAYYLNAVYTEALFLALCLAAAYFANRHRFWLAGGFAALATLTRNTGILVLIVLIFEYLRYRDLDLRIWRGDWWKKLNLSLAALFIPIVVLVGYCVSLKFRFHDYLAFLHAEHSWSRSYMWPWLTFYHTLSRILHSSGEIQSYFLLEAFGFVIALVMLLLGLRYLRKSLTYAGWWMYLLAVVWISSSAPATNIHDYLYSFPRFVLMLFPGFVFLAAGIRPRWLAWPLVCLFALGLLLESGHFAQGIWIA